MPPKGFPTPLSGNAQKQYDNMSKCFDSREYVKAVRHADNVLSLHPNHPETMAMKGLCLHTMEKREEGHALVKEALTHSMTSSLVWHCLGLCYKGEKNVVEALKAFKQSVKMDPTNGNALRDVSSACIQVGDWEGLVEVRQKLVAQKSGVRANWIALSCAHRLAGNLELATQVLEVMLKIMDAGDNAMEKSEVHLFRADLELLQKRPNRVLEILKNRDITDASEKLILRAKAMGMLNQREGAEKIYFELINKGISEADCAVQVALLRGITMDGVNLGTEFAAPYTRARCLPLRHYLHETDPAVKDNNDKFVAMLDDIVASGASNNYNSSSNSNPVRCWEGAKRLALDCVTDLVSFKARLAEFLKPYILRTIPAVISILKSIYQFYPADSPRVAYVGELLHEYERLIEAGTFSATQNPMHAVWIWQALSSHYMRIGNLVKAHEYVDKAIAHTPTMEQLYLLKAKISRRGNNLLEAAELAEKARIMDLQDRYLNNKATKYWLRVGDVERAESVFQLFLKASQNPHDAYLTGYETQCTWFERELGDAFLNPSATYEVGAEMVCGEKGLTTRPRAMQKNSNDALSALQNYLMFEYHHQDNHEELSDFHNYTFRRCNMRQFVDVQLTNHNLATQHMFLRFCAGIVKALMQVAADGEDAVRGRHVARPPPNSHASVVDAAPLEDKEKEKERQEDIKRRGDLYTNMYNTSLSLEQPLSRARPYVDALLMFQGAIPSTHELAIEYFLLCQEKEGKGYFVPIVRSLSALKAISTDNSSISVPVELGVSGWGPAGFSMQGSGANVTVGGAKLGGMKSTIKNPPVLPGSYLASATTTMSSTFPSSTTLEERAAASASFASLLQRFEAGWSKLKCTAPDAIVAAIDQAVALLK